MGKFDLNPEEMKKFDLTAGELAHKESRYPAPKSFSAPDSESSPMQPMPTPRQQFFPGPDEPGGRPQNWTNNPNEAGDIALDAVLTGTPAAAVGIPFRALRPSADFAASAARMASSASAQAARAATPSAAEGGVTALAAAVAKFLLHRAHPILNAAKSVVPATASAARAAAPSLATDAAAAGGAALGGGGQPAHVELTPGQRAAMFMLGIGQVPASPIRGQQ